MKKILTLNRCNSDNFGDQLISFALKEILSLVECQVDSEDFILQEIKQVNITYRIKRQKIIKLSNLKRLRWVIKNFSKIQRVSKKNYDTVIIGGGQLINSNTIFPIAMFVWICSLSRNINTSVFLYGVGCDKSFSFFEKLLYKYALSKVDGIYVRDRQSEVNIKNNFNMDSTRTYDLVFGIYDPIKLKGKNSTTLLGVTTLNRFKKYKQITYFEYLALYSKLLKKEFNNGREVKLFYTTHLDYIACLELKEAIQKNDNIFIEILDLKSFSELCIEIAKSQKVISQRMHALLVGLITHTEVKPIIISNKLNGFSKEFIEQEIDLLKIKNDVISSLLKLIA